MIKDFDSYDNFDVKGDVKWRDHFHMTGKYRVLPDRDCNINVKLNHKTPIKFHNQKQSWLTSHYTRTRQIQRHTKWIRTYMSFNINNKFSFIDRFQFLSSSLDSLVKNSVKIILSVWAKNLILKY